MKLKRLSPSDFDRIVETTRLKGGTRQLAYSVLVDGRKQSEVAQETGYTKQRISLAIAVVEKAYFSDENPGGGVVEVALDLPHTLAFAVSDLSEALMTCSDPAFRSNVIADLIATVKKATVKCTQAQSMKGE